MKALYLVFHGFAPYNGISKKIGYQVEALKACGVETVLCYLSIDDGGYHKRMIDGRVLENYGKGTIAKIRKRVCYAGLERYIEDNNIDLLYIRSYHNANPFLIRFLKKSGASGTRVVMEIPTFPYDGEYGSSSFTDKMKLLIDKVFRKKLASYIYRMVTYSGYENIFGVRTIRISNGINFDMIKVKDGQRNDMYELNMLGVAELHFWHGYDRIVAGMAEYYKTERQVKVFFRIVGYGDRNEISRIKNICSENSIEKYVCFAGPEYGADLDNSFEQADIGIASLGRHRSGISRMKSLKNMEYAARGIPFVYSENDDNFDDKPYVLKVPADDTPVDIGRIVDFYFGKTFDPAEIRSSVYPELSWKTQMQKVLDEISPLEKY